jgi:hypothetical protein
MKWTLREAFIEAATELQQVSAVHYDLAQRCGGELARRHQEKGAQLSMGARLLVRRLIDRRRVSYE